MIVLVFAACLALTILVEGAFVALVFRRRDYVYYSVLCNLLTNPALNLALLFAVRLGGALWYAPALAALELLACVLEAFVLRLLCGFPLKKAAFVSLAMNALSFSAGLLLNALLVRLLLS